MASRAVPSSLRVLRGGLKPRPPEPPVEAELLCTVTDLLRPGRAGSFKMRAAIDAHDKVCYLAMREDEGDALRVCGAPRALCPKGSLMREILHFVLG